MTACGACNATCTGPGSGSTCGDGIRCEDTEACDDGNAAAGDYCSSDCTTVTGWCGDGTVQTNERCDDGHATACGPCDATCTGPGTGSTCGDGVRCSDTEVCDDGNTLSNDFCAGDCRAATGMVEGGFKHTCAVRGSGALKCWGGNGSGQLGLGGGGNQGDNLGEMGDALPAVSLGTGRKALGVALSNYSTCAVIDDGSVRCWGSNSWGELGLGDTLSRGGSPADMGDGLKAVDLGTGRRAVSVVGHASSFCAQLTDGTVKCWGWNGDGHLGVGGYDARGDQAGEMGDALPAADLGSGRVVLAISAGVSHTCALLEGGAVKCWGLNDSGQLGIGSTSNRGGYLPAMGDALPAVDLGTGRTARMLACGGDHSCALLDDGSVKCWGSVRFGQLGLPYNSVDNRGDAPGEMGDALPPLDFGAGRTVLALASKGYHTCAVLADGSLKCWGYNSDGQLGLGDQISRVVSEALPSVSLGTGRKASSVYLGEYHTCSVLDDGSLKCWGYNDGGGLGLGDTVSRGGYSGQMGDALPAVSLGAP